MLFAYSGLHVFTLPDSFPAGITKILPVTSLLLPELAFSVSFLDEHVTTDINNRSIAILRWIAMLANTNVVIFDLTCVEEEDLHSRFRLDIVMDAELPCGVSSSHYAINYAVGTTGNHIIWISVNPTDYVESPAYTIAPLRKRQVPTKYITDENYIPVDESKIIPKDGLPFSCSVSCLDFDDGHGVLLIGSHAGQFCLVNFTNALLPDESIHGQLPAEHYSTGGNNLPEVIDHLHISIHR